MGTCEWYTLQLVVICMQQQSCSRKLSCPTPPSLRLALSKHLVQYNQFYDPKHSSNSASSPWTSSSGSFQGPKLQVGKEKAGNGHVSDLNEHIETMKILQNFILSIILVITNLIRVKFRILGFYAGYFDQHQMRTEDKIAKCLRWNKRVAPFR
jgi:hypothetical protein